ncbi:hypothetical protein ELI30_08635 [Rhizobium leguminosarum]|uniref:hypothetical protein n=1 Tax=Rhizobium leguminosarum TaxID=384 RepID=UPI00102FC8C9|nr:hypothetical protein [Rhizobium leguminosarum]TAV48363.1 hypothetical protein ELI32_09090 [Rhizobium leguminosarum]TAV57863.1 hypothetical protein ELI31_08620 [Rhizobium leguminosarum]TAV68803.1 hypothetical protein ELI30_08635 [Rhizobium leguminosarum]
MATTRRLKRTGLLVRFQPWLVAGGVLLNVIASGAAAFSAYYSWKQTGVAIDAVNITSRNQAFSEYLAAFTEVCKVSLVPQDQDDMWTFRVNQESYDPPRAELFEIRELYEDRVEPRTPEQIDAFLAEATKKREAMGEKWAQLQIWLDESMADNLSAWGSDYDRFFLDGDKMPAAYYAVRQQRRCRVLLGTLSDLYKNPDDETAKKRQTMDIWVLPMSETKRTDDLLKEWGRPDIIDTLTEKKLWPLPE